MKRTIILLSAIFCIAATAATATVRLPEVITDNMVLQQGKKVCIWGEASPGEKVSVAFMGQKKTAETDRSGQWRIFLDEMTATAEPQKMTVKCGKKKIILENILVGEVWLASGQSNMEYSMNNHPGHPKPKRGDREYLLHAFESADNPLIRVLHVRKELKSPLPTDGWKPLSKESLAPISAAAYFFADSLSRHLDVPVGIISSAWGGTPIEQWTSAEAYDNSEVFGDRISFNRLDGVDIAKRFDYMISPMIPYTLRGFLWYQGEQNVIQGDTDIYTEKMKLLIEDWRKLWNDSELPFYYVQLAPYTYSERRNDAVAKTWESLPEFWMAQQACLSIPNTGMAVINDLIDSPGQIHPSYKWSVGWRLAGIALNKTYGCDINCFGPTFKSVRFEGDKAVIEFDNVGDGLKTDDDKDPDWFWMADKSGRYFKADAKIVAPDRIEATCKRYSKPISVRFAWDEVASPNLFNSDGLPAMPFGPKPEAEGNGSMVFPDGTQIGAWFYEKPVVPKGERYAITDFGVLNDSTTVQTEAIQRVIDMAAENGGGTIVVPEGVFLSGSLFFKPGTSLFLEEKAVLKGSDDISDFKIIDTRMEGQCLKYFAALVNAEGNDGFSITGKGTINGNGERFWRSFWLRRQVNPKCTNLEELRPRLVYIHDCDDVLIQDVTLKNSPFWTTHLYRCSRVKILNTSIFAPAAPVKAPSSDAIDIDVCSKVLVKGCRISVNDDAIALKGGKGPWADREPGNGPNSEIIIEDCDFGFCHSALTCGSESIHNRNIIFRNCRIDNAVRLLWLKMRPDTPQTYEYITVSGITGEVRSFLYIQPWTQFFDLKDRKDIPMSYSSHVTMENISVKCKKFFDVKVAPDQYRLSDFTFRNLNIEAEKPECDRSAIDNFVWDNVSVR